MDVASSITRPVKRKAQDTVSVPSKKPREEKIGKDFLLFVFCVKVLLFGKYFVFNIKDLKSFI